MNIRNTVRKLSLLGGAAALPVLATVAMAGGPTLDSDITGNAGTTTWDGSNSGCTFNTGTCADVATGTGFRQETVDIGGTTYVRTLIAETDSAEGDFGMETYVQLGGTDGLHGTQIVSDPTGASFNSEGFYMATDLDTGWANTSGSDGITITQSIVESADDFATQFQFHENATDLGGPTDGSLDNKQLKLGQQLGAQTDQHQNFVLVENDTPGSGVSLPTFTITVGGTTFSDTNASGAIDVLWIGTNLGATFGLEDVATGNSTLHVGNDKFTTPGFSGTTPVTSAGFDFDTALGTGSFQPSF